LGGRRQKGREGGEVPFIHGAASKEFRRSLVCLLERRRKEGERLILHLAGRKGGSKLKEVVFMKETGKEKGGKEEKFLAEIGKVRKRKQHFNCPSAPGCLGGRKKVQRKHPHNLKKRRRK